MKYADIVFLQDGEGSSIVDELYQFDGSVTYEGVTDATIDATVAELAQWDMGDYPEVKDTDVAGHPWGSSDDVWDVEYEGSNYILSAHCGLGYVGLIRVMG